MGFSVLLAETLLLRQLLIAFSGNELAIGIILVNGLVLEALYGGSHWTPRSFGVLSCVACRGII